MKNVITLILFILIGFGIYAGVKKIQYNRNFYTVTVELKKLNGLEEECAVDYLGVDIGKVLSVTPDKKSSLLLLELEKRASIPKGSRITANEVKELETTVLRITPSKRKEFYEANDTIFLPELDLFEEMIKFGKDMKSMYDKTKSTFEEDVVPFLDSLAQEYEQLNQK